MFLVLIIFYEMLLFKKKKKLLDIIGDKQMLSCIVYA